MKWLPRAAAFALLAATPALADSFQQVPLGAWTPYTPTVTAGSNSYTTASATGRWQQTGKAVDVSVKLTVTTVGGGGGSTNVTLPSAVSVDTTFVGRNNAGAAVIGTVPAGTQTVPLATFNGAGFAVDGTVVVLTGRYEAQ